MSDMIQSSRVQHFIAIIEKLIEHGSFDMQQRETLVNEILDLRQLIGETKMKRVSLVAEIFRDLQTELLRLDIDTLAERLDVDITKVERGTCYPKLFELKASKETVVRILQEEIDKFSK